MIKYKGFPVAPANVEFLLLEHPAVRDCGVVGEIPYAFVILREGFSPSDMLDQELRYFVADRLAHHKQPREIRFVEVLPRTPSELKLLAGMQNSSSRQSSQRAL
jgi:acyl-coenzyme A synthetase/AMP-(fatty) acid ligase